MSQTLHKCWPCKTTEARPQGTVRRPAPTRRTCPCRRTKPKVFLMDEPLSNLDAKLRVQTREELIKLHRRLASRPSSEP